MWFIAIFEGFGSEESANISLGGEKFKNSNFSNCFNFESRFNVESCSLFFILGKDQEL